MVSPKQVISFSFILFFLVVVCSWSIGHKNLSSFFFFFIQLIMICSWLIYHESQLHTILSKTSLNLVPSSLPLVLSCLLSSLLSLLSPSYFIAREEQRNMREVLEGLLIYFDQALGSILLYRFERPQYADIVKVLFRLFSLLSLSSLFFFFLQFFLQFFLRSQSFTNKRLCEVYGAEHLLRLFGSSSLCVLDPISCSISSFVDFIFLFAFFLLYLRY